MTETRVVEFIVTSARGSVIVFHAIAIGMLYHDTHLRSIGGVLLSFRQGTKLGALSCARHRCTARWYKSASAQFVARKSFSSSIISGPSYSGGRGFTVLGWDAYALRIAAKRLHSPRGSAGVLRQNHQRRPQPWSCANQLRYQLSQAIKGEHGINLGTF